MEIEKIDLDETDCFSSFFLDYINGSERLTDFYSNSPTIEHFEGQIKNRSFPQSSRDILVEVLKAQYQSIHKSESVNQNIESLKSEKTFTVTTGHQLNIFTGPLYFIYKIVSAIRAAESLKEKYPEYHFVPVYWAATEDHDFDEINHFHLRGKKHQWDTNQTGAVGRFDPSELKTLIDQLPGDTSVFNEAYLNHSTLAAAGRAYVNTLFGDQGIVVVDADHPKLKELLIPVIEKDLFDHLPEKLVNEQSEKLEALGYKCQVHPREVNFFYLENDLRARLEKTSGGFKVVDSDLAFTDQEVKDLIKSNPERFSPNVILRPLYQELILPNLAYIGGPSELVYWLQLKSMFDEFSVPFPLLMPRNFGMVVPTTNQNSWTKTGFSTKDLFKETLELEKQWIQRNSQNELSYQESIDQISKEFDKLQRSSELIDPTLVQHLAALKKQATNKLEKAEKKLLRAEKRKHEAALGQIHKVKEALFPNGGLQERRDNFLNFYQDDPDFLNKLLANFDAFDYRMFVLKQ